MFVDCHATSLTLDFVVRLADKRREHQPLRCMKKTGAVHPCPALLRLIRKSGPDTTSHSREFATVTPITPPSARALATTLAPADAMPTACIGRIVSGGLYRADSRLLIWIDDRGPLIRAITCSSLSVAPPWDEAKALAAAIAGRCAQDRGAGRGQGRQGSGMKRRRGSAEMSEKPD